MEFIMTYEKCGMNIKTKELLLKDLQLDTTKEDNYELDNIYSELTIYTMIKNKILGSLIFKHKKSNITNDPKTGLSHYKNKDFDFDFYLLSQHMKNNKKELESSKRLHKCHEKSLSITRGSVYDETYLLTGYITYEDKEVLHSVMEFHDNGEFIVDYTMNIIMPKTDYFKLTKFRELSRLKKDTIEKDIDIMRELKFLVPFYFIFRDEIVRDLKKNDKVLNLNY